MEGVWVGGEVGPAGGAEAVGRRGTELVGSDSSGETKMERSSLESEKLGWLATSGRTIASIGSDAAAEVPAGGVRSGGALSGERGRRAWAIKLDMKAEAVVIGSVIGLVGDVWVAVVVDRVGGREC